MPVHVLVETRDHEEMTETMRSVYGSGLRMGRARTGLAFHQEVLIDDGVTIGNMAIGAEMGVGQEGFADWAIARLRSGKYTFHGRDDLDITHGQTFVMPPVLKLRAHTDTPSLDVVQISPAEVLQTILDLYPFARAAHLSAVTPITPSAAAAWWATADAYTKVLNTPELYSNDLVRRSGWQHLLALSVQVFGLVSERPDHTDTENLVRPGDLHRREPGPAAHPAGHRGGRRGQPPHPAGGVPASPRRHHPDGLPAHRAAQRRAARPA